MKIKTPLSGYQNVAASELLVFYNCQLTLQLAAVDGGCDDCLASAPGDDIASAVNRSNMGIVNTPGYLAGSPFNPKIVISFILTQGQLGIAKSDNRYLHGSSLAAFSHGGYICGAGIFCCYLAGLVVGANHCGCH